MPVRRFEITPDEINRVIRDFYREIREHVILGPVFARHIRDWPGHEEKIASFWRKAILFEEGYDGNPMEVHRAAGDLRPEMFGDWLALFDEVLQRNLSATAAASWSALAHRIGRGLRHGLAHRSGTGAPAGQVILPDLR